MKIEFDPAKDIANQLKHGVSRSLAGALDWEAALVWVMSALTMRNCASSRLLLKPESSITLLL